ADELSYSDTATVAAALWLPARDWRRWSGQWLHWRKPDEDPDETCPEHVWKWIQEQKRQHASGPPTYYAVLMADADRLGQQLGLHGKRVSAALTRFALREVRDIVERHSGELIYSGGDDTLALLPTEKALACAAELRSHYQANWRQHVDATSLGTISA